MYKPTKTQRKEAKTHARLLRDQKFQNDLAVIMAGGEKVNAFIERGIAIQTALINK